MKTGKIHENACTKVRTERPKGAAPPCDLCPKCDGENEKSPRAGRQSELSARNERTLKLYHQRQAGAAMQLSATLREKFGLIHAIFDEADRLERQRAALALEILARR